MGWKTPQLSTQNFERQESDGALAASVFVHACESSLVKNNTGEVWNVVPLFSLHLPCVSFIYAGLLGPMEAQL